MTILTAFQIADNYPEGIVISGQKAGLSERYSGVIHLKQNGLPAKLLLATKFAYYSEEEANVKMHAVCSECNEFVLKNPEMKREFAPFMEWAENSFAFGIGDKELCRYYGNSWRDKKCGKDVAIKISPFMVGKYIDLDAFQVSIGEKSLSGGIINVTYYRVLIKDGVCIEYDNHPYNSQNKLYPLGSFNEGFRTQLEVVGNNVARIIHECGKLKIPGKKSLIERRVPLRKFWPNKVE